jgi:hypothetical protein
MESLLESTVRNVSLVVQERGKYRQRAVDSKEASDKNQHYMQDNYSAHPWQLWQNWHRV